MSREGQVKDVEGQRQDQRVCEGVFWMLRTLMEEKNNGITHLVEKLKSIQICCKTHISINTRVVQKTDCEHNHISMNPLKGRRP